MRGMADKAWASGFNVVRLNQRNCGGTEHLSRGLYHSGLTADPLEVMRILAGDDGSAALRLRRLLARRQHRAEARRRARRRRPQARRRRRRRVAADRAGRVRRRARAPSRTSPTTGTSCAGCAAGCGGRPACFPARGTSRRCARIRTVRAFDDAYTAPYHGFAGAADYYHRASARRVLDRLAVPALLITADDDPFVPSAAARDPALAAVPRLDASWSPPTAATAGTSDGRRSRTTTATGPNVR